MDHLMKAFNSMHKKALEPKIVRCEACDKELSMSEIDECKDLCFECAEGIAETLYYTGLHPDEEVFYSKRQGRDEA